MSVLRTQVIAVCIAALMVAGIELLAGGSPSSQNEYATVLAHRSCAPWDGPAVAIEFYTSPTECGRARSAQLNVNLWRNLPLKDGQKFELSRGTTDGSASLCARENQCELADSGAIWTDRIVQGKTVSGRYEFAFKRAGHVAGKFRAVWCENRQLCR